MEKKNEEIYTTPEASGLEIKTDTTDALVNLLRGILREVVGELVRDSVKDAMQGAIADVFREEFEAYTAEIREKENEKLMTQKEVTARLGVSAPTLWRWEKSGLLVPVRFGGKKLYKASDLKKIAR